MTAAVFEKVAGCDGAAGGVGVKAPVAAAFFNDAGVGKDEAGLSRLPLLDRMGIPGMTVSSDSARIGFGDETYRRGSCRRSTTPPRRRACGSA
jgi:hypothetical protein